MYIDAQKTSFEPLSTAVFNKIPKKILLVYSIQYLKLAKEIRKYLMSKHHEIIGFKQVLGCSKLTNKDKSTPILLIGSGKFHARNLASQTDKLIYIYTAGKIQVFGKEDAKELEKRKTAALSKFLASKKIGILVSSKPGQNRMADTKRLVKTLEGKGKKPYIFVANNFNLSEIENFSIDFWVNTACPGLAYDSTKLINIDDLSSIKY